MGNAYLCNNQCCCKDSKTELQGGGINIKELKTNQIIYNIIKNSMLIKNEVNNFPVNSDLINQNSKIFVENLKKSGNIYEILNKYINSVIKIQKQFKKYIIRKKQKEKKKISLFNNVKNHKNDSNKKIKENENKNIIKKEDKKQNISVSNSELLSEINQSDVEISKECNKVIAEIYHNQHINNIINNNKNDNNKIDNNKNDNNNSYNPINVDSINKLKKNITKKDLTHISLYQSDRVNEMDKIVKPMLNLFGVINNNDNNNIDAEIIKNEDSEKYKDYYNFVQYNKKCYTMKVKQCSELAENNNRYDGLESCHSISKKSKKYDKLFLSPIDKKKKNKSRLSVNFINKNVNKIVDLNSSSNELNKFSLVFAKSRMNSIEGTLKNSSSFSNSSSSSNSKIRKIVLCKQIPLYYNINNINIKYENLEKKKAQRMSCFLKSQKKNNMKPLNKSNNKNDKRFPKTDTSEQIINLEEMKDINDKQSNGNISKNNYINNNKKDNMKTNVNYEQNKNKINKETTSKKSVVSNSEKLASLFADVSKCNNSNSGSNLKLLECQDNNELHEEDDEEEDNIFGNFLLKKNKKIKYCGNMDKKTGKKNGYGKVIWSDNSKLQGIFYNSHLKGYCKFSNSEYKSLFYGEYVNNIPNGFGIYETNLLTLQGYWKKNELNGYGIEIWNDGTYYQGEFLNTKKNGIGLYRWPDGTIYQGQFINNEMTGIGMILYSDNRIYAGEILNGYMEGYGIFTWGNGNKYMGYYLQDIKHGFGIFIWTTKPFVAYIGFWEMGRQQGAGVKINGNKNRYSIWKRGKEEINLKSVYEIESYLSPIQMKYYKFFKDKYIAKLKAYYKCS